MSEFCSCVSNAAFRPVIGSQSRFQANYNNADAYFRDEDKFVELGEEWKLADALLEFSLEAIN